MHPDVFELVTVQPKAADQENSHVVFRAPGVVFPAIPAGGAFRGQGLRRDRQAKDEVCFDLPGMSVAVGDPYLDRAGSPDVVQVQIIIAVFFVVCGCIFSSPDQALFRLSLVIWRVALRRSMKPRSVRFA